MNHRPASNPLNGTRESLRWARRKRFQRLWESWLRTLPAVFLGSTLVCLSLWIIPVPLWAALTVWIGLVLFSIAFALLSALSPLSDTAVLRDIDQSLQTDDLAVTVGDPSLSHPWRDILHARLQPRLASLQISRIWPLSSTSLQKVWIAACILMSANVFLTATAARTEPDPPVRVAAADTEALNEMLDEWKEIAPELQSDEFQAILEEVEQLRAETEASQQTPAERMELLSKIEAIVERHQRIQSESSIAEHADDLAALLESVEGMSGTAAALRRGEFSTAGKSLEEIVASLMQGEEMPSGATSENFQRRAEELSKVAHEKGDAQLSESLKKLSEAAKEKDSAQWCESAGSLGDEMNKEGARSLAARMMQAQLDQLEARKLALSQKKPSEISSLASLLPTQGQDSAGLQAGTGPGSEPFGDPTQTNAELETLALAGTAGEGDSTRETVRSSEAPTEFARAGGQASFEEYQMLSTQAIHDESLPLVHRETIRRYFERIRPKNSQD